MVEYMCNKRIILASASPRRLQILKNHFNNIVVEPSNAVENFSAVSPSNIVMELAKLKLDDVICRLEVNSDDIVIAADTIVWYDGKALGKPTHYIEARDMLRSLSNRPHEVYSGYAIWSRGQILLDYDRSVVRFKKLSDKLIDDYIATGSPFDKAGGYGIQDSVLVEEYAGDYDNILGLPSSAIEALKKIVNKRNAK